MSFESDQWANDRRNGTLDDPIDPNWRTPKCCSCPKTASLVITPRGCRGYGSLELGAPYDKGSVYYCSDHYPDEK
jgi:hypothetical protein